MSEFNHFAKELDAAFRTAYRKSSQYVEHPNRVRHRVRLSVCFRSASALLQGFRLCPGFLT